MIPRRKVIKIIDSRTAIVDSHVGLFGNTRYTAVVLAEELRPVTVCRTFGVYDTEREAAKAATDALALPSPGCAITENKG